MRQLRRSLLEHHRRAFSTEFGPLTATDFVWRAMSEARTRNSTCKRKTAHRFEPLLHDFSFALGFLGTPRAHAFVTGTLGAILPQRAYAMHKRLKSADVLLGPGFYPSRFAAARRFYDRLGYGLHVYSTSTDATATRQQLTVDVRTRRMLGLCTLRAVVAGATLQDMVEAVSMFGIARVVDVFLLNPLDSMLPSFVLGVFPQQSTPKHEVLMERWSVAHRLLAENGTAVLAHGGDGDAAQLCDASTHFCGGYGYGMRGIIRKCACNWWRPSSGSHTCASN